MKEYKKKYYIKHKEQENKCVKENKCAIMKEYQKKYYKKKSKRISVRKRISVQT